jgi:hypothetical protein
VMSLDFLIRRSLRLFENSRQFSADIVKRKLPTGID